MSRLAFHVTALMNALATDLTSLPPKQVDAFDEHALLHCDVDSAADTDQAENGWETLRADSYSNGLHTQGRWQADLEIATSTPLVLLAQILPTRAEQIGDSTRAVIFPGLWLDVLLHHIPSDSPVMTGLSMLEISAYRLVNSEVRRIHNVKASPMPMEMMSVFNFGYRIRAGKLAVEISSDTDNQAVTYLEIGEFGETLPIIKLRSGRHLPPGIFRAKYRQTVSWSA
jgi:hypothetical protein